MHIISHTKIIKAQKDNPDCKNALEQWYRLTKRSNWQSFSEVKGCFPATDKVGDKFVFDIGGIEWLRSKATLSSLSLRERAGVRVIECRFTSTWLYNKLRLIAAIHFNTQRVFIRAVLTHKGYDKGDWK